MNMQEFAALKVGDKIKNPMNGSAGVVSGVTDSGIRVQWGASAVEFYYSANSTAWMHWSKTETAGADDLERHEGDLEDRERG